MKQLLSPFGQIGMLSRLYCVQEEILWVGRGIRFDVFLARHLPLYNAQSNKGKLGLLTDFIAQAVCMPFYWLCLCYWWGPLVASEGQVYSYFHGSTMCRLLSCLSERNQLTNAS
jgi:hypothetical protein